MLWIAASVGGGVVERIVEQKGVGGSGWGQGHGQGGRPGVGVSVRCRGPVGQSSLLVDNGDVEGRLSFDTG